MSEYTTIVFVMKGDLSEADEIASFIGEENNLAIMDVHPSTEEEIKGFNPAYLAACTGEPLA